MEIVLGPPGTGKTTFLLEQMEQELDRGTPPGSIGFVSFTRRAAQEARERAKAKFGLGDKDLPWVRTLHSLCFAALGLNRSVVFEGKKLTEFSNYIGQPISTFASLEEGSTFGFQTGDRCLFIDNMARVRGVPLLEQYNESNDNLPWPLVENFSKGLVKFKAKNGYLDFTDMLARFVEQGWNQQLQVLFVDEAQDLSMLQWHVVARLAKGARRVAVAGDDDQAIYRWAGAAVDHFIALPGQETVLGYSWRVPPEIQDVALRILARVSVRRAKLWEPRKGTGVVGRVSQLEDAGFDITEDTLVLGRNSCFLQDDAIPWLNSFGYLYEYRGNSSVRHSLVEAILNWERLRRGEEITVEQAAKIYAEMKVHHGFTWGNKKLPAWKDRDQMVTLQDLKEAGGLLTDAVWYDALVAIKAKERIYMTAALRSGQKLTEAPKVRVSTIHGAKGAQADHVIILTDRAWRTYVEAQKASDDEARTWYVAATRAKHRLTIVSPQRNRERSYNL